jgi:hypothetical protein
MSRESTPICNGRAERHARAGQRSVPCAARVPAAHKRPSMRAPLVSAPTTGASLCRGRWLRPSVPLQTTEIEGPS